MENEVKIKVKNIDKFPITKDALDAYNNLVSKT